MSDKKEFATVYLIINTVTWKIYVGVTTETLCERLGRHMRDAYNKNRSGYNSEFCKAIREFGKGNFIIIEWEPNVPNDYRKYERENFWIRMLNTKNPQLGYNEQGGNEFRGRTPEYSRALRAANPEKNRAAVAKYYKTHHETEIARHRKYRETHIEEMRANSLKHYYANKDEINARRREKYAAEKESARNRSRD